MKEITTIRRRRISDLVLCCVMVCRSSCVFASDASAVVQVRRSSGSVESAPPEVAGRLQKAIELFLSSCWADVPASENTLKYWETLEQDVHVRVRYRPPIMKTIGMDASASTIDELLVSLQGVPGGTIYVRSGERVRGLSKCSNIDFGCDPYFASELSEQVRTKICGNSFSILQKHSKHNVIDHQ